MVAEFDVVGRRYLVFNRSDIHSIYLHESVPSELWLVTETMGGDKLEKKTKPCGALYAYDGFSALFFLQTLDCPWFSGDLDAPVYPNQTRGLTLRTLPRTFDQTV